MTTRIEDELRRLFDANAERFEMDDRMPPRVARRARSRAVRAMAVVAAVAVAAGAILVATLRGNGRGPAVQAAGAPVVRLVDYLDASNGNGSDLRRYAQCMRAQGFAVPDPVRNPAGWTILVPTGSIDRSSPAWQQAAFVTCRITKFVSRPLSGDLILGNRTPGQITAFLACMKTQGFDLPKPTRRADGQFVYDLRTTPIDTGTDAWNRAVFLTCAFPGD